MGIKETLKERTLVLAKRVIQMCTELPKSLEMQIIRRQLIKSITSVGANYHAACRAKSYADFIHKLHIVEEECDESIYWAKLIQQLSNTPNHELDDVIREMNEILSITIRSIKTVKERNKKPGDPKSAI